MAGRELNIRSKVPASTILEVVVSMVIIVIVFGIAMMIYNNVLRLSLSSKNIKAEAILQQALLQAEQGRQLAGQSLTVDDFRVEQEIQPYGNDGNLTEIDLTAYDANQQKAAELKKVILNK